MPTVDIKMEGKIVASFIHNGWEWFISIEKPEYEITGKYLFFSNDREELRKIAKIEIETNGFHRAKIILKESKVGDDYVLCLYYRDDSRKHEMARKYQGNPKVKYRYWKSDADTREGKYSEQFLIDFRKGTGKSKLTSTQTTTLKPFMLRK